MPTTPPLRAKARNWSSSRLRWWPWIALQPEWLALAGVRQVDEHAELVHLAHDLAAEVAQALGRARGRVRLATADPRQVVVPHQGQHAHAVRVEGVQVVELAFDRVAALDAGDARHQSTRARRGPQLAVAAPRQLVGMRGEQGVELAEQRARARQRRARALGDVLGVDPIDEHHGGEAAFLAAHEVEVAGGARAEVVAQVELTLQRIDVRVEDAVARAQGASA
jgi:hypothetical protein